ncbi:MAG: hypothetical protein U9Q78_09090 [Chloroflexota bacterium]|nr:hypothetical protein [Chloroflexota bacterium]
MPHLNALIWFILTFPLLLFLKSWINQHLQGMVLLLFRSEDAASLLYFMLLLPGVLIHEGSHWLMAKLLWVPTGKFTIGVNHKRGDRLELGSIRVGKVDPIRSSLIGLAPLVGGSLVILLIGRWALDVEALAKAFQGGEANYIIAELWGALHVPDFWLWLYLVFAISNTMLPSASDRRSWPSALIFLGGLIALLYFTGWVPPLRSRLTGLLPNALSHLNLAFTLTLTVDVVFALLILLLETLLTRLTGWKVKY